MKFISASLITAIALLSVALADIPTNDVSFSLRKRFLHEPPLDASNVLDIVFSSNSEQYTINVNGDVWFESGATKYRNNGQWVIPALNHSQTHSGSDIYGDFDELSLYWKNSQSGKDTIEFVTSFRTYPNDNQNVIVFSQSFPNGLTNTSVQNADDTITAFPSFKMTQIGNINLGFVHWSGIFTGYSTQYGTWDSAGASVLKGSLDMSGPLSVVDSLFSNAVVIAPLTNHMAASDNVNTTSEEYSCGIVGNVTSIPSEFKQTWIMTLTKYGGGVNVAMKEWGDKELKYYNKQRGNAHLRDYTLNYLGYSTDHGAYYYYYTEPNKNYQETMVDVKKYVDSIGLPVKYVLLDSWWYYKGVNNGVKNWKPMPDVFPNGMQYVHNATDWPIQAHNRYWSINNIYSSNPPAPYTNTGDHLFPFNWGSYAGLPKTRDFWDYLFRINDNWGLIVYEQDWLSTAEDKVPQLSNNVTFGQDWLLDMGLAALDADLSIQYCMAFPRHVLTSVQLQSVTQTRASSDYTPSSSQWRIGVTSIFASSIDLMPSKDSVWTMSTKQGSPGPYTNTTHEPYPRLQACVLSLSNGPVAFGDGINRANSSLIMRACDGNGLLLRPELPATAIERVFSYNSFKNESYGVNGQVWATNSIIGENIYNYQWFYLFVADLDSDYNITVNDLMFQFDIMASERHEEVSGNKNLRELRADMMNEQWVVYESNTTDKVAIFDQNHPLQIKKCELYDFQLYTFVPLRNSTYKSDSSEDRWYLQGEIDKWIGASAQRFENIEQNYESGHIGVTINGAIGEKVNVAFVNSKDLESQVVSCTIGTTQRAVVKMPDQTCESD